jgi:hypothetical protein
MPGMMQWLLEKIEKWTAFSVSRRARGCGWGTRVLLAGRVRDDWRWRSHQELQMALEASICSVIQQVEGVRRNARAREEHWV